MPGFDLASMFTAEILTQEAEGSRVFEAVVGIVTDNKDPQKLGRVKVAFPMFSTSDTSWWAPIVMLGAGKNRGWFFIPEVDDEVLVMFEHGHLDRPIVIGSLWNGKDKPPDQNPGGNPRRMIKSRSGSKITFDDDGGKITIEDGAGKGVIELDASSNNVTIKAGSGDVCFQTPSGDLKIVCDTAELTAGQNVEFHAGDKIACGTDAGATISGSGGVTLSGAKVNIKCDAAQAPPTPSSSPQDVKDPYGS